MEGKIHCSESLRTHWKSHLNLEMNQKEEKNSKINSQIYLRYAFKKLRNDVK